jgi:hypothetical protein
MRLCLVFHSFEGTVTKVTVKIKNLKLKPRQLKAGGVFYYGGIDMLKGLNECQRIFFTSDTH